MGLLNTGMRRGELAGLTWEDIDFDHCTVHVDKSLLIVNKGYHLTTTKEDNVRDIDVAPEFMEYLKTYRDQWLAQKHRMGSAWQTCMDGKWESYRESLQKLRGKNFIVINDFGWPISPDHYGKIVDRVAEKAGIRKIHPHMFRHTFVTLAIKDTDGNTVTTWVSTDEPHRVTGLHFGESYTLTEIRAADGYALADNITFCLIQKSDEDGNPLEECEVYYLTTKNILFWKWDDWKLLDDATVIMQDDITKVQISKKDLTTNEELPGAELIITDEKGSEIDRWISTDAPHYMEKLPAGKYTLTEVTAPDGYAIAERMEFEVLPNGEVQTFEMFDDTIKVKISKVDITTNEELPGAELVIKDKDGTEIDRWISTNGPHYVEKMPAGDYTLTEITAPNGYKVAESIDFTVLPTGEMQTVVMKDAREDTPTPTPDNTPTPNHTPQPTPNTTPAPTPVPAAPTATPTPLLTIPKTGDNSSLGLLLAIAGISLAGLAVLVHKSARRKDIAPRDDDDEDTED